jgi:hypothetical protein
MVRLFHGRQGTAQAVAGQIPGLRDPADPARMAKAYSNVVSPVTAAASMHDDLGEEARKLANGSENVPIHPAQVPTEGSDTQETEGDGSVRDPTGIGRGT